MMDKKPAADVKRDKSGHRLCEHGKQRSRCRDCGGSSFCEHNRERNRCVKCGGSGICEHKMRRANCRDCGGSGVCEHGRRRQFCKECVGSSICEHRRQRRVCSTCQPDGAFRKYRRDALKRWSAFLMLEEFKTLVAQPCVYCGESTAPRGVDRWDNKVGYTLENSRPCCGPCNLLKKDLRGRTFIDLCRRIGEHTQMQWSAYKGSLLAAWLCVDSERR